MKTVPLSTLVHQPVIDSHIREKLQKNSTFPRSTSETSGLRTRAVTEYYKATSLSLEFTSKDGDTVSVSMESVEYSKSILDVAANGTAEDMKKLADFIKDTFASMKKDLFDRFFKQISGNVDQPPALEDPQPIEVPEEWDAAHTAQRIVDFSLSFFGAFKGSGDEYLATIKDAIEKGFEQAREMLGELPDEVNALIDETHLKVMEKLSAWAVEQKITPLVAVDPAL